MYESGDTLAISTLAARPLQEADHDAEDQAADQDFGRELYEPLEPGDGLGHLVDHRDARVGQDQSQRGAQDADDGAFTVVTATRVRVRQPMALMAARAVAALVHQRELEIRRQRDAGGDGEGDQRDPLAISTACSRSVASSCSSLVRTS